MQKYLFRAVSDAELADIAINGIRNKLGAYETGKLFALNIYDATRFGKNNFLFDNLCNSLIQVSVPVKIYQSSVKFEADGMVAILIEKESLFLLEVEFLNHSPI